MFWRATSIAVAALWTMAASAQIPSREIAIPESPGVRAETERAVRGLVKNHRPDTVAVCSIPLREVPVAKRAGRMDRMPILRPRKPVEPMPLVPMFAPPCKEENR